jgi:hypothetical protein
MSRRLRRGLEKERIIPRQFASNGGCADCGHFRTRQGYAVLPSGNRRLADAGARGKFGLADLENLLADVADGVHTAYLMRKRIKRKRKFIRIGISQPLMAEIAIYP